VRVLTPNEKGAIAEAAVVAAAIEAGVPVLRPVVDGARYDIAFDFGDEGIQRVQCKWGRLVDEVILVKTATCRHSPTRGYIRTTYSDDEVDAFGIYCGALNRCYYVPITLVAGKSYLYLRLSPARNNQHIGVTMAADYEFGAVAQLGERLAGSQKVRGSSPLSSTP
jgi:PD-(D/E)XK endonuclease